MAEQDTTRSEAGFTETDEAVPSDTMLAEGSHAPTVPGETETSAASSRPLLESSIGTLPIVSREHYAVGAPFAKGGIGQISAAMDRRLGRRVAIKELRRSTRYAQLRFAREIKITAKLQHPNIVQLHEAGRWSNGEPFFAMKLVDGDSLEGSIESCVTLKDRLHLMRHVTDVADAMAHAHTRCIVHRDLKPGNVLVGPFGETVVIDWGLAKDLGEDEPEDEIVPSAADTVDDRYQTTEGVVLGTPSYMPPEQAAGRAVDERADVYALGAIMYQCLSGKTPYFEFHPKRVLERVVATPPTPLAQLQPDLPKDLLAIVEKAMSREPEQRYRTAARMAEELHRYTNGRLVAAYDYSLAELARRFVKKHAAAVATALIGCVVIVGFGAWSFRRIARERDAAEAAREAEAKSRELEALARADAERRLDDAVLSAARSDLERDPTRAVARLKRLGEIIPGAATVVADAVERGVAVRVLRSHADRIDAVAYSADGSHLASSGVSGTIVVMRRDDKTVRKLEHHVARVPAIAFHDDVLVSADYEGVVVVWDVASGEVRRVLSEANDEETRAVAVSSDGTWVATVSAESVRVWTMASGAAGPTFAQPSDRAGFASFVPNAQRLLTGSHGGVLRVWDLVGEDHWELAGHQGPVHSAAVSPDGRWVISAGDDGTVRRWDLSDHEAKSKIIGRHDRGAHVAKFLDASRAVTGGMDGQVVVWDVANASANVVAQHEERVTAITTHGGRWIATAGWDKRTYLIDEKWKTAHTLRGHDSVISALAFAPDGAELASASWDRTVRLWKTASPNRQVRAHGVGVKTVAFDATGKRVASGGHDDRVRVWEAETGTLLNDFAGHTDHVFRVLFAPDGKRVASSSDDRTVRLWNLDGSEPTVFEGHEADVEELAFSPDGAWLASAGEDAKVGLFATKGQDGTFLVGHEGAISAVQFMPDSDRLVSASMDGTLILWSASSAKRLAEETLHPGGATSLAISDGGLIVSAGRDGRVMAWDGTTPPRVLLARTGVERVAITADGAMVAFSDRSGSVGLCALAAEAVTCRSWSGHEERIHAMHFSDDSLHLVTGSEDGTVRIWSTATGESRPLRIHHAPVFDLALHGDQIATASGDRTIGLVQLVPPPTPEGLRAELSAITEMVLGADVDAAAAPAPSPIPSAEPTPSAPSR